jgi:transposase
MNAADRALAQEVAALKAALATAETKGLQVAAELAVARAKASEDTVLIAQQKLRIAKLERQVYGQRSERSARLIDQLSLTFEELEAGATEDELAAEAAVAKTTNVAGFTRKRPERNTFPDHLPRERVVIDPPTACECCGGARLRKLGEDVTRTLETQPRQWKVIETIREKFTCRDCEKISQAPAPFHAVARGWAGPSLLAMIVFEKFGQHQPLNRQAERYALEGVPIALSTMADAVGSVCAALDPLRRLLEAYVMAAERLHGDDTTVPVLAKGKTDTGRCWVYVRDDRPFGGTGPPAAMFYYSRDRRGEHPQAHLAGYSGILQADAYDGYNKLYLPGRSPGPIQEAACWVHYPEPIFMWSIWTAAQLPEALRTAIAQDNAWGRRGFGRCLGDGSADPISNNVGCRDLRPPEGVARGAPSTLPPSSRRRLLFAPPRRLRTLKPGGRPHSALVLPRGASHLQSPSGLSLRQTAGAAQLD